MFWKKYKLRYYNLKLVLNVFALMAISIIVVNQADSSYTTKHVLGIVSGIGLMVFVSFIDYHLLVRLAWPLYFASIVLLALIWTPLGVTVNGAKRWINLPGLQIQPSEIAKIILIIFAAAYLEKHKEDLNTFKNLLILIAACIIPISLILAQPNLSTTIITFAFLFCMIYIGGLSMRIIVPAFGLAIPAAMVGIWYIQQPGQVLLQDYQLLRVLAFLNPQKYSDSFWQQENSITAIASGQLYGNLVESSGISVNEAGFLSESQTDFIFAMVGQELGFIGTCGVIILFILLIIQLLVMARKARDTSGMLICAGFLSLIATQSLLNIGVATAVLPNTGVTLPFVSSGLTSLWSSLIGIGLVLNVGMQRATYT